jgi:tetratricopeptide (TPR) repeat protein
VDLTSPEVPTCAPYLMNLGAALAARARLRPTTDDLDRGILVIEAALAAARPDDPRRPAYRANLADALRTRFRRAFDRTDIDRAVEAARTAVAAQPSAAALAILGGALLARSESAGDERELAEAIQFLAGALHATPEQHSFRPRRMAGLAAAFRYRAEVTNDVADLERAEALLLAAARAKPERAILVNLSAVVIRRAQLTGDDVLLDRAIAVARGVDRTNLATALHLRAARSGNLATLDEALAVAEEEAAGSAPGSPEHVTARANLAAIRQTRYLRTGRGADLDAAVDAARVGADGTPSGDPELPGRLANLGNVLRLRGVRTRSPDDLDEAVQTLQRAARLARTDRAGHLSNLGAALQSRAEVGDGDPADAPPVLREAVAQTPPDSPYRPLYLSNLGNALVNVGDAAAAVDLQREALSLLPHGHPDRAVVLGNLATALGATDDDAVLPDAIRAVREVAHDPAANGQDRLLAAWRLADLEVRVGAGDAARGAPAMRLALELADRAAWIGTTPSDRVYTLTRFSSLALDAAAALAGDPAAAVAALETGRGVGWRAQLQQRHFDALADRAPALAGRLRAVGAALDRPLAE